MLEENLIRQQLASYLANDLSLGDFENWFEKHVWTVHQARGHISTLAYEIEEMLTEYSDGHIEEYFLQRILQPLAA